MISLALYMAQFPATQEEALLKENAINLENGKR
jgi:hypothetical protein